MIEQWRAVKNPFRDDGWFVLKTSTTPLSCDSEDIARNSIARGQFDDEATARRVAAAPDLLEALKRLHETGLVREFNTPENKAALAAIAKAEGR